MKTIFISSAISLVIGFAFGWLVQGEAKKQDELVHSAIQNSPELISSNSLSSTNPVFRENRSAETQTPTNSYPQNTRRENVVLPETSERSQRAKWQRLVETLDLDSSQTKAIEAVLNEIAQSKSKAQNIEQAYIDAGKAAEEQINAVLNEQQKAKFAALQARSLENRIESGIQEIYYKELREFDFTAAQREQVLSALRKREEEIAAQIPASARLMLENSFLPIGEERFSEQSLQLMNKLKPEQKNNPSIDDFAESSQNEHEQKALLLEGVLSPAQLELYRANIAKQADLFNHIRSQQ